MAEGLARRKESGVENRWIIIFQGIQNVAENYVLRGCVNFSWSNGCRFRRTFGNLKVDFNLDDLSSRVVFITFGMENYCSKVADFAELPKI